MRVRIQAELTVAEPCRTVRDAVLPTLAWAPEGWGCEGAIVAPSRINASASRDEVGGGGERHHDARGGSQLLHRPSHRAWDGGTKLACPERRSGSST